MDKVISAIENAKSQNELRTILDKNFTKRFTSYAVIGGKKKPLTDKLDVVAYNIDVIFDSTYHTGKCKEYAYDGKCHDYGKGKWSLSGDNAPTTLSDAKHMALHVIKNHDTKKVMA